MTNKNTEAIYSLSPSQQGLLFETLSASEPGIHIEQISWSMKNLDLAAFEQAWQRVLVRHSSLRTAFVWKNVDEPLQVVLQQVEVPLERQNWCVFSSFQQQEKLKVYLKTDRLRGFKLTKAPLMRLALFQISENAYQIVWTHHHILIDGWSVALVLKEFWAFYEAFSRDQDLSLEPSRSYRDYITWLKQQDLSKAEAFWRETLQSFTTPTTIGIKTECTSFPSQKERHGQDEAHLPASITAALQSWVRQHHLTLNVLIQGVWALLLSRYSGESDVIFGNTVSGRPPTLAGVESIIGLFINSLPMRIKISSNESLRPWLQNIQAQNVKQQAYEYCSTGQVHQWSEVPNSSPLYESLLVFENYPVDSSILQSSDLKIDLSNVGFLMGAQTKYALTILVGSGSELKFKVIYDSYRFDSSDVIQILEHFLALLKEIVAASEQHLKTFIGAIPTDQIPKIRLNGKVNHCSMLVPDEVRQELREIFVAPRDELELHLTKIWEKVLGIQPISVRDNLFDLGGHSLIVIPIIAEIEKALNKKLPLATLFQLATVEQLASSLRQEEVSVPASTAEQLTNQLRQEESMVTSQHSSPLSEEEIRGLIIGISHIKGRRLGSNFLIVEVEPGKPSSKRPFFYLGWGLDNCPGGLGADRPVYWLPMATQIKNPATYIKDLAALYVNEIRAVQPEGPYLLGGECFGWPAFEIAQQLQAQGQKVALLALLDCKSLDSVYNRFLLPVYYYLFHRWANRCRTLCQLSPAKQLTYVLELTKRVLNRIASKYIRKGYCPNISPDINDDDYQTQFLSQYFEAAICAQENYIPQPYSGRVALFFARWSGLSSFLFPKGGWGKIIIGELKVHIVPGDHMSYLEEPHVWVLAKKLKACLDKAEADALDNDC
jgi:thioesterase domain-containing protein/acyl carrier protein